MKINLSNNSVAIEENKTLTDEKTLIKTPRRSLYPLQKSATDKENLVGAGRSSNYMTPNKGKLNLQSESKSTKKLKVSKSTDDNSITVDDLTSEEEPGKEYYKILAERRRIALDESLKENESLHNKIKQLEEESAQYKNQLKETLHLVDVLNEMLEEKETSEDETDNKQSDDSEE